MEDDAKPLLSPILTKPQIQKEFQQLDKTIEEAQKRIDYTIANNPDILRAIDVVERFLRKNKRVCYGGQAINAQLPKERQFYDMKYTIPDYDFFSPTMRNDVEEIIKLLEKEGFTEVNKKLSVHEGTIKVYVNFIPVADCSEMHPQLFRIIQRRANVVNGIYYADADFLRMFMYLELSRPRGEVERWKKVYERLTLLNDAFPVGSCSDPIQVPQVSFQDRRTVLDFCIIHKRVVCGPEWIEMMEKDKTTTTMDVAVQKGGPVLFFSHKAATDAEDVKEMLGAMGGGLRVTKHEAMTDQLFTYTMIKRRGQPLVLIFQEEACHGYMNLRLEGGQDLRIATPDLYLHLYYTLEIFGKAEKQFFTTTLQCLIDKLHTLLKTVRGKPGRLVPSFSLRCSGHQKGIATLLREKAERTEKEKKKGSEGGGKTSKRKTRKNGGRA